MSNIEDEITNNIIYRMRKTMMDDKTKELLIDLLNAARDLSGTLDAAEKAYRFTSMAGQIHVTDYKDEQEVLKKIMEAVDESLQEDKLLRKMVETGTVTIEKFTKE